MESSDDVQIDLATQQTIDWGVHVLFAEEAWARTRGDGVTVAILDTGGQSHPDLDPNVIKIVGPFCTDQGHGLHVAGLVAAADNGIGVVGVAPCAKLLLYNVLGNGGMDLPTAIAQAVSDGADIISMSLGSSIDYPEVHDAVKAAYSAGVILIAADGNDPSTISYPAAYPEVIGVSAVDNTMSKAVFAPPPPNHLSLPGVNVLSCWLDGQYARLSGTSQATPLFAGCVALMLSLYKTPKSMRHSLVIVEMQRIDQQRPGAITYVPNLELL